MSALPPTVYIAGLTFYVVEEVGASPLTSSRAYGVTDLAKQTITIRGDMADGMKRTTLIHEMLHVLFLTCGLNLDSVEEERYVAALEAVTFRWLAENDLGWVKG